MDGLKPRIIPILEEEAARHGLTLERFLAPIRLKERVRMRQYAMWRIRNETGRSWSDIARAFNQDHTTVQHGYRVIESLPPEKRSEIPHIKRPFTRPPTKVFLGKPCRHGHAGLRYASRGYCVDCISEKGKLNYARKKEGKSHEQEKTSPSNFQCTAETQTGNWAYAEGAR